MRRCWWVVFIAACGDTWQVQTLDRVCEDVGYSISAVAFTCSGNEDEAQAAHDAFTTRYSCRLEELHDSVDEAPLEVYYTCPAAVGAVDCDAYQTFAADDFAGMDAWLAEAPACATILAYADGGRLEVTEP